MLFIRGKGRVPLVPRCGASKPSYRELADALAPKLTKKNIKTKPVVPLPDIRTASKACKRAQTVSNDKRERGRIAPETTGRPKTDQREIGSMQKPAKNYFP